VPVLCAAYLLCRLPRGRTSAVAAALVLAGAGVAVLPWLVRNKVSVGCFTLTTDGRALWKANNPQTYGLLSRGEWIDNVAKDSPRPPPPNRLTPEEAWGYYIKPGEQSYARSVYPSECAEMSFYEHLAWRYVEHHPGGKARLAALSAKLLWQPNVFETSGRPGAGTRLDLGRRVAEPAYMWAVYVLAAAGLFLAPRAFLWLALALLAYQTVAAFLFVGATRYRIAWDFLVVLLATAALVRAVEWVQERRRARREPVRAA
jgi:hypothetical protein